jgi:hypothetical protein
VGARELGTGDLDEFRRAGHALVDAVADHLAALPSGRSGSRCRTTCARSCSRCRSRAADGLGAARRDDGARRAAVRDGERAPGVLRLGQPAAVAGGVLASLAAAAMNPSVVSGDHADVHLERTSCAGWRSWSATRTRRAPAS